MRRMTQVLCLCGPAERVRETDAVTNLASAAETWRAPVSRLDDTSSWDREVEAAGAAGSDPASMLISTHNKRHILYSSGKLGQEALPHPWRHWVQGKEDDGSSLACSPVKQLFERSSIDALVRVSSAAGTVPFKLLLAARSGIQCLRCG